MSQTNIIYLLGSVKPMVKTMTVKWSHCFEIMHRCGGVALLPGEVMFA